ncbi:MAG: hypothetical protein AAFO94_18110, partial [Bacteroidota bacterium]
TVSDELIKLIDHPDVPTTKRPEIATAAENLVKAHDGMRDWMQNVKMLDALAGKSDEEIKNYFSAETEKIKQISANMKSSLDSGNQLLNEIKPKGQTE